MSRCMAWTPEGRCKQDARIETAVTVDKTDDEVVLAFVVKMCMDHTAWLRFSLEEEPDEGA